MCATWRAAFSPSGELNCWDLLGSVAAAAAAAAPYSCQCMLLSDDEVMMAGLVRSEVRTCACQGHHL